MKKSFVVPAQEINVVGEYDCIVVGGGPAGMGAAWAAGRHGANTLLIEQSNSIGGMATSGMMSHWVGNSSSTVYHEILRRAIEQKSPAEIYRGDRCKTINHEVQKRVMLEMLEEQNVKIQLCTKLSDVIKDGNKVTGIITESKSGREAIFAKIVIDCTGDGDVAALADAEFKVGREGDNKMQPATLMFKIGGVDNKRAIIPGSFESLVQTPKGEIQALARQILPPPAGHVLLYPSTIDGITVVNMTNVTDVDGTDVRSISAAEITCTKQIPKIMAFLNEYAPGYENAFVIGSASNIGIRETRHVVGEYTMTAEDIVNAERFDDWIATDCWFNFDIHNVEGAGLDANGEQHKFKSKGNYTVPYRCCLPVEIEGLLVAGRAISGTHKAHSNYRAMPICCGIGQGCGTAAAVAVANDTLPRNVDIRKVQELLNQDGVN